MQLEHEDFHGSSGCLFAASYSSALGWEEQLSGRRCLMPTGSGFRSVELSKDTPYLLFYTRIVPIWARPIPYSVLSEAFIEFDLTMNPASSSDRQSLGRNRTQ